MIMVVIWLHAELVLCCQTLAASSKCQQEVRVPWSQTFGASILRIEWMGFSNVPSQSLAAGAVTREFLMLSPQVWIMFPAHHYPVAWYWSFSSPNTRNICLKLYLFFFFFSIEGNFLLTVGVDFIDNVNFCHSLDHANLFLILSSCTQRVAFDSKQ